MNGEQASNEDVFQLELPNEVKTVTREQLIALAQKGAAALPELQSKYDRLRAEVDELKSELSVRDEFIGHLQNFLEEGEGSEESMEYLAKVFGLDDEDVAEITNPSPPSTPRRKRESDEDSLWDDEETDEEEDDRYDGGRGRKAFNVNEHRTITLKDLDPSLREALLAAKELHVDRVRQEMERDLQSAIAQDEVLGKIISGDKKRAQAIVQLGKQALRRRVLVDKERYLGQPTLKKVVDEVREFVDSLGVARPEEGKEPKSLLKELGLGPVAQQLGDVLHQERPPEREPVTSGTYRHNLLARLAHRIVKGGGEEPAESQEDEDAGEFA